MKNIANKIKQTIKLSPLLLGLTFGSCDFADFQCKEKENDKTYMVYWADGTGNHFKLVEKDYSGKEISRITGHDNFPSSKDSIGDGKIDEFRIKYFPSKGSILETYTFDSINKLYNEVKETGCDCK